MKIGRKTYKLPHFLVLVALYHASNGGSLVTRSQLAEIIGCDYKFLTYPTGMLETLIDDGLVYNAMSSGCRKYLALTSSGHKAITKHLNSFEIK